MSEDHAARIIPQHMLLGLGLLIHMLVGRSKFDVVHIICKNHIRSRLLNEEFTHGFADANLCSRPKAPLKFRNPRPSPVDKDEHIQDLRRSTASLCLHGVDSRLYFAIIAFQ